MLLTYGCNRQAEPSMQEQQGVKLLSEGNGCEIYLIDHPNLNSTFCKCSLIISDPSGKVADKLGRRQLCWLTPALNTIANSSPAKILHDNL